MEFIFCITGTKLYMNWFLLTNPTSKNPIIKFLWGWMKKAYTAKNYRNRYGLSKTLFIIHFIMFLLYIHDDVNFLLNLAVNIYPMLIQIYIGMRCRKVIKWKEELNKTL